MATSAPAAPHAGVDTRSLALAAELLPAGQWNAAWQAGVAMEIADAVQCGVAWTASARCRA